ncbi:MAG: hypothetical protein AB7R55_12965 [Gemmatimonadales bacterium]
MTIDWTGVAQALVAGGAFSGAAVFVAKGLGRYLLELNLESHKAQLGRQMESHKAQLAHVNAVQLERLRSELALTAAEHNARVSRVADRQAEVIAKVYGLLEEAHIAFRAWAAITKPAGRTMAGDAEEASEAYNALARYYWPNAIWLDRQTCDQINAILETLRAVFIDLTIDVDAAGYPKEVEVLKNIKRELGDHLTEARRLLEARLREILGVSEPRKGDAIDGRDDVG